MCPGGKKWPQIIPKQTNALKKFFRMITVTYKQWEWLQRKMDKKHTKGEPVFIRKTVKVFSFTWRDCLYTEQAAQTWIISAVRGAERGGRRCYRQQHRDRQCAWGWWTKSRDRAGNHRRMIIQHQWDKLEGYKMKLSSLRYGYAQRLRRKLLLKRSAAQTGPHWKGKVRCPWNFICISHEQAL